jgi:hypothetical protein
LSLAITGRSRMPGMKATCGSADPGRVVRGGPTVMAQAITRGHRVRVLGTEGLRARQGRPARHSAVAIRSCNDLAQPGTGLVKDRDACAATVMAGWQRDGQGVPRLGESTGP